VLLPHQQITGENLMKSSWLVVLLALALGGCLSFSSSNPPPPNKTTVVVPPGSTTTTVCSNGSPPPCQ
jgi:hypothetical protein